VSERPRVDVGVVTWNTRELSVAALRRLLDTDQGVEVRLFVRDNGSSDGTPDAIARSVPEARLDADGDNLGFGRGMNRLISASDAPWFLALNSDAWPQPGALRRLVDTGIEQSRAAAVAPRLERPDGTLEHSTHRFPSVRLAIDSARPDYAVRNPVRARNLLLHGAWDHAEATDVDWAVGAALLMRREALDDIGGFDDRLFMYAEDLDWCWRAHEHGWTIRFEPRALIVHVGNASAVQSYAQRSSTAYWLNTYRVVGWRRGPLRTWAYRLANAAGAARAAHSAGDNTGLRAHHRRNLRAHLRPLHGPDGPPSTRS
jgi:N-acetylglucosaminyl-diphospho-decaprenol L-rhamnosyltransferase